MRGRSRPLPLLVVVGLALANPPAAAAACDDLDWFPKQIATLSGEGGTLALRLHGTAGCTYGVSTYAAQDEPERWIHAEQASLTLTGTDADVARFRFDLNPTGGLRLNHLLFESPSAQTWSPTVQQEAACAYPVQVDRPQNGFPVEGGAGKVHAWPNHPPPMCPAPQFSSSVSWVHVDGEGGFTVDANDGGDRTGTIFVAAPPRWAGEAVTIYQAGVAAMDGGGDFGSGDDGPVRDPLADALVNEEPGFEAALALLAMLGAAAVRARRGRR